MEPSLNSGLVILAIGFGGSVLGGLVALAVVIWINSAPRNSRFTHRRGISDVYRFFNAAASAASRVQIFGICVGMAFAIFYLTAGIKLDIKAACIVGITAFMVAYVVAFSTHRPFSLGGRDPSGPERGDKLPPSKRKGVKN